MSCAAYNHRRLDAGLDQPKVSSWVKAVEEAVQLCAVPVPLLERVQRHGRPVGCAMQQRHGKCSHSALPLRCGEGEALLIFYYTKVAVGLRVLQISSNVLAVLAVFGKRNDIV